MVRLAKQIGRGQASVTSANEVGKIFGSELAKKLGGKQARDPRLQPKWKCSTFACAFAKLRSRMESHFHERARRLGLELDCDLTYIPLPMTTGTLPDGKDIVEIVNWPFVLPESFASWLHSRQTIATRTGSLSKLMAIDQALLFWFWVPKANAALNSGYLAHLVDVAKLQDYWDHMLRDYPNHPLANAKERWSSSFGVTFYADEAKVNNENFMHLMWTSDLSPHLSHALASRILITVLPESQYAFDGKANVTLQAACHAVVTSFNKLSEEGSAFHDPVRCVEDSGLPEALIFALKLNLW